MKDINLEEVIGAIVDYYETVNEGDDEYEVEI